MPSIEIPDSVIFQADQIEGKDLDNTRRKALLVLQVSRLQNGKFVSGEPDPVLYKTESFNVQQTTVAGVNIISGIVSDTSIQGRISTWLGVDRSLLNQFFIVVEANLQLSGSSANSDDLHLTLDALGGSVLLWILEAFGDWNGGQKPIRTVYPVFDAISGKSYDLLFLDAVNWAVGETHNTGITLTAYRMPDNSSVNPSRVLV